MLKKSKKAKNNPISNLKKYIKWCKESIKYKVVLLNIYYDNKCPHQSYIKDYDIRLTVYAANKRDLFKKLKTIYLDPILSYSYKTYNDKTITKKITTREDISKKYAINIVHMFPQIKELKKIYSLENNPMYDITQTGEELAYHYLNMWYDYNGYGTN